MSNISEWSTTAASNNSASPNGFPEGMAPSGVNDSAREVMAAIKTWYTQGFRDHLGGLRTSLAADVDHDVTIAVGACMNTTSTELMTLTSALTKQIDLTWEVGNNKGGMESGTSLTADTDYGLWLIKDVTNDVTDAIFSASALSVSSVNLPTGYTIGQLIGHVRTNSASDIIGYVQRGDYFRYTEALPDTSDATLTSDTFEALDIPGVPPHCLAHIYGVLTNTSHTEALLRFHIRHPDAVDAANTDDTWMMVDTASDVLTRIGREGWCMVDASSDVDIAAREADGTATITINVIGFEMLTRGRGQ